MTRTSRILKNLIVSRAAANNAHFLAAMVVMDRTMDMVGTRGLKRLVAAADLAGAQVAVETLVARLAVLDGRIAKVEAIEAKRIEMESFGHLLVG